ncbi:MAG TPA: cytidylate kinase family protein, partial [Terracidiphilus sp.]
MRGPIRVITVEREYGSRGAQFAHELADRLGWRLLDEELVARAARAAGVPEKQAAKFDDRLD